MSYAKIIFMFIVLQSFVGCGDEFSRWPHTNFDKKEWKETPEKDRYVFVRSLIEREKLIGFTQEQIFELLGKPSFEDASEKYQTYVIRADAGSIYLLDIRFESRRGKKIVAKAFVRVD